MKITEKNKLTQLLTDLGLTEKEARVYLASLSLGPATVLKISRTAGIKRTTGYPVIQSLQWKGLMVSEPKGLKQVYTAESPEKLEAILEYKRARLHSLLPNFMGLYNLKGDSGFIKYYEGPEAIRAIYDDIIKDVAPNQDYMAISSTEKLVQLDRDFFEHFFERRSKRNIRTRLLLQDSEIVRYHKKFQQNFNERVKILPAQTKLTTNLIIIPQRVVIHQLTPPNIAIVIENPSTIQMLREIFDLLWSSLPE